MFIPSVQIPTKQVSNIETIDKYFRLPISYNSQKKELNKNIISDLELFATFDPSGISMYKYAFQPKTIFGEKIMKELPLLYTTDTRFLRETQRLLKNYKSSAGDVMSSDNAMNAMNAMNIMNIWDEIKNDTGFKEKYHYIDWAYWEYLNNSEQFLQIMSIYNLAAPVISLIVPFIILIVPFFILKIKGLEITMSEYTEILQLIASNHAIGKLFTKFNEVKIDEKIYLLLSAAFYVFSIYQNILTCVKFHENMKKIHSHLDNIKKYLENTEKSMSHFLLYAEGLSTYSEFNTELKKHLSVLCEFKGKLNNIRPYELTIGKVCDLGGVLKCFYEIYNSEIYNDSFMFSFGYHGYIDNIKGLIDNIDKKHMQFAKFTKKMKKSHISKSYHPSLINENPIKNSYHFDKNMIITGPNASGKTTVLKSTLINIIITQQMGCGFYEKAEILPFKHIHCYLNIPDTSGRDSLFQAEARRCKDILDIVHENPNDTHFCVFDELYSGTNPEEAVKSASAFMVYLMKYKNINSMLTTHFIELCNLFDNKQMENCHMHTERTGDTFSYTYELKKGVSTVKGGFKVLEDMNYPREIIDNTNK